MKPFLKRIAIACACLITSLSSFSQTTENFDSRNGVNALQVKDFLEDHCWQFKNLAINTAGDAASHGDGSLVSINNGAAGFHTPVLNLLSAYTVSFTYAFHATSNEARSINIYHTSANNEIISLVDKIDVSTAAANIAYTYTKTLPAASSVYKIHISYQGTGNMPAVKLDDLAISANKRYASGCNDAPTAASDVINGFSNREASGNIMANDSDPNAEAFTSYLITDSKDGKVSLSLNGNFTFTPNAGFTGSYTSFTYQICDFGYNQLCSQEATVIISFPELLPASIADLQANHNNSTVTLKWLTEPESNIEYFEIERSVDGSHFEKAGPVKAAGTAKLRQGYVYEDKVPEKMSRKNDLYYRLKQVDRKGKSEYSKVILVRVFKTKTLQAVSITPNPAINDIKVNVQLNEPAYVVIRVRSVNGDELIRNAVKASKGDNSFTLQNSRSLKKGVYMLEVIVNSNERMVVKLVKN